MHGPANLGMKLYAVGRVSIVGRVQLVGSVQPVGSVHSFELYEPFGCRLMILRPLMFVFIFLVGCFSDWMFFRLNVLHPVCRNAGCRVCCVSCVLCVVCAVCRVCWVSCLLCVVSAVCRVCLHISFLFRVKTVS